MIFFNFLVYSSANNCYR